MENNSVLWAGVYDEIWERKYGIAASHFLDPKHMIPDHPSSKFANFYQPVRAVPYLKMLENTGPDKSLKFVDIGAGMGKAMLLAAHYGFKNIEGIELVPEIVEHGKKNLEKKGNSYPDSTFVLEVADALEYDLEEVPSYVLLNDPFDEPVMDKFIDKFLIHLEKCPNSVFNYKNVNDRKMSCFEKLLQKMDMKVYDYQGNLFEIYTKK